MSKAVGQKIAIGLSLTFLGLLLCTMTGSMRDLAYHWKYGPDQWTCRDIIGHLIYAITGKYVEWYTVLIGLVLAGISFIYTAYVSLRWSLLHQNGKMRQSIIFNQNNVDHKETSCSKDDKITDVVSLLHFVIAWVCSALTSSAEIPRKSTIFWHRKFILVILSKIAILLLLFWIMSDAFGVLYGAYLCGTIVCIALASMGRIDAILLFVPELFWGLFIFWLMPQHYSGRSGVELMYTDCGLFFVGFLPSLVCCIASILRFCITKHWYFIVTSIVNILPILIVVYVMFMRSGLIKFSFYLP